MYLIVQNSMALDQNGVDVAHAVGLDLLGLDSTFPAGISCAGIVYAAFWADFLNIRTFHVKNKERNYRCSLGS
jgi:hypothetical protein